MSIVATSILEHWGQPVFEPHWFFPDRQVLVIIPMLPDEYEMGLFPIDFPARAGDQLILEITDGQD